MMRRTVGKTPTFNGSAIEFLSTCEKGRSGICEVELVAGVKLMLAIHY
jgi:hypothetical protein